MKFLFKFVIWTLVCAIVSALVISEFQLQGVPKYIVLLVGAVCANYLARK